METKIRPGQLLRAVQVWKNQRLQFTLQPGEHVLVVNILSIDAGEIRFKAILPDGRIKRFLSLGDRFSDCFEIVTK